MSEKVRIIFPIIVAVVLLVVYISYPLWSIWIKIVSIAVLLWLSYLNWKVAKNKNNDDEYKLIRERLKAIPWYENYYVRLRCLFIGVALLSFLFSIRAFVDGENVEAVRQVVFGIVCVFIFFFLKSLFRFLTFIFSLLKSLFRFLIKKINITKYFY